MKDIKKEEKRSQWETIQDVVTPKQSDAVSGKHKVTNNAQMPESFPAFQNALYWST